MSIAKMNVHSKEIYFGLNRCLGILECCSCITYNKSEDANNSAIYFSIVSNFSIIYNHTGSNIRFKCRPCPRRFYLKTTRA